MSASQRRKGAAGENEAAAWLSDRLGTVVKRKLGQARDGGCDLAVGPFRIEVKRRARISSLKWLEQAQAACEDEWEKRETYYVEPPAIGMEVKYVQPPIPVVLCRQDRGDWVIMFRAEDALTLMRGEL